MSKKAWIIFAAACIILLGGLIALNRKDQIDVSNVDQNTVIAASDANGNIGDHVYGSKDGKAMLIEYGDFQCPACGSAFPILKELKDEFKEDLTFVFRNNPLTSIHPNARAGSAAAEAAGLQGKYWEMHDMLFEKQSEWSEAPGEKRTDLFVGYAKQVGVKDSDKFISDMASSQVNQKINFDLALGKKIPVEGTPTILLDGNKIEADVWRDKDTFKSEIEKAIK